MKISRVLNDFANFDCLEGLAFLFVELQIATHSIESIQLYFGIIFNLLSYQ